MTKVPQEYKLLNSLNLGNYDVRSYEYTERLPEQGERITYEFNPRLIDRKNVKAELIIKNLLSRKDIMALYKPPMKRSEDPANNPFINRGLFTKRNDYLPKVVGPATKGNSIQYDAQSSIFYSTITPKNENDSYSISNNIRDIHTARNSGLRLNTAYTTGVGAPLTHNKFDQLRLDLKT
jgi:hypothetical protein